MENNNRISAGSGVKCQFLAGRQEGANDCIYPKFEVPCSNCGIFKAMQDQDDKKVQATEAK